LSPFASFTGADVLALAPEVVILRSLGIVIFVDELGAVVLLPVGLLPPEEGAGLAVTSTIAWQSAAIFPPHVASTFATTPSIVVAAPAVGDAGAGDAGAGAGGGVDWPIAISGVDTSTANTASMATAVLIVTPPGS